MSEITIFYDGACHLCSREINHYRKKDKAGKIQFIDIAHQSFNADKYGLDKAKVNKHMHVQLSNGQTVIGVDAFIAIWNIFPSYKILSKIASLPLINQILKALYEIFAMIRPLLPKKKYCEDGTCYL